MSRSKMKYEADSMIVDRDFDQRDEKTPEISKKSESEKKNPGARESGPSDSRAWTTRAG